MGKDQVTEIVPQPQRDEPGRRQEGDFYTLQVFGGRMTCDDIVQHIALLKETLKDILSIMSPPARPRPFGGLPP